MPPTSGLITSMERDVEEARLGGWFNGNPEDVPESWSGSNSGVSSTQDRVGVTLLTTIGGRTLPNPVRVPDNMVHPAVLTSLMEGPVRPWQCLVWSEESLGTVGICQMTILLVLVVSFSRWGCRGLT